MVHCASSEGRQGTPPTIASFHSPTPISPGGVPCLLSCPWSQCCPSLWPHLEIETEGPIPGTALTWPQAWVGKVGRRSRAVRELTHNVHPHSLAQSCPYWRVFVPRTGVSRPSQCDARERAVLSGRGLYPLVPPPNFTVLLPAWAPSSLESPPDVPLPPHCFPNEIFMKSFCLLAEKPPRLPHLPEGPGSE